MCLDLKKGNAWFGGGSSHFNADGSGYLAGGSITFNQKGQLFGDYYSKSITEWINEGVVNVINLNLPIMIKNYVKMIRIPYEALTRMGLVLRLNMPPGANIIYKDESDILRKSTTSPFELTLSLNGYGYIELTGSGTSDYATWILEHKNFGMIS